MDIATIRESILNLTVEERAQLMVEIGPDLCRAVMQTPDLMQRMMPRCEEMMQDADIQRIMRPMMERMMENPMGWGGQHG